MKPFLILLIILFNVFLFASPVSAHIAVKPDTVGIAATQDFTVTVPNEKEDATVGIQLVIPHGVKEIMPYVKTGWTISVKKNGDEVTEIDWAGGSIPANQKDQFSFSAQAPAEEKTIEWKAYQMYQDGSVVSWDQKVDPNMSNEDKEAMEKTGKGPSSETKIINDLKTPTSLTDTASQSTDSSVYKILSIVALVLSVAAIGMQLRKRSN